MSKKFRRAHREMWAYLKRFPDATAAEIADLRQWVKDGNSPYENGDFFCDDNCHPMDFIGTMRFWDGMSQEWLEDPESFSARYLSSHAEKTTTDIEEPHEEGMPF